MKRIVFLGLALVLGIFVGSCSQPLFPHGGTDGAGGRYFTPDPPQGFENAQGTTVIEQLQWLQTYATSTGSYMVWARLNEPHIPGGNEFGIDYDAGRDNIRVRIGTVPGIARQTLQLTGSGFMLNVGANNILELENINLQGLAANTAYPVVHVTEGTLRMRANSEIRGNGGGGVTAINNSDITMNAGSIIIENSRGGNGGGVSLAASTLTMNGGVIQSNISFGNGGGVSVSDTSKLTILDGSSIQYNISHRGGGVSLSAGRLYMNGGIIHKNTGNMQGGGVYMQEGSAFTMNSGSIQYNISHRGGGVRLDNDNVLPSPPRNVMTMFGNARIHANQSTYFGSAAGGIYIGNHSTLKMRSPDAVISANQSEGAGGGIFITGDYARLQISDGRIYGLERGLLLRNYARGRTDNLSSGSRHVIGTGSFDGDNSGFSTFDNDGNFIAPVLTSLLWGIVFGPPGVSNNSIIVTGGQIDP